MDFIKKAYTPEQVLDLSQKIKQGEKIIPSHTGNLKREI
mgnify:CR=1 FL=1